GFTRIRKKNRVGGARVPEKGCAGGEGAETPTPGPSPQRGEGGNQTTSRTVFASTVLRMSQPWRCWPLASALAKCQACSIVTWPGIGGSLGSTTASTSAGPLWANASR